MTDDAPTHRRCSACAEEIRAEAKICRFCGSSQVTTSKAAGSAKLALIALIAALLVVLIGATSYALISQSVLEPQPSTNQSSSEAEVAPESPSSSGQAAPSDDPPQPLPERVEPEERPKTQEEILIEQAASEQLKTCQALWAHDLSELDDTWGEHGHADVVLRHYEQLSDELRNDIPIGDFNVYRDRMLDSMHFYWQMADLWREIEVYTSWEVWTPMMDFWDDYEALWNRCSY